MCTCMCESGMMNDEEGIYASNRSMRGDTVGISFSLSKQCACLARSLEVIKLPPAARRCWQQL